MLADEPRDQAKVPYLLGLNQETKRFLDAPRLSERRDHRRGHVFGWEADRPEASRPVVRRSLPAVMTSFVAILRTRTVARVPKHGRRDEGGYDRRFRHGLVVGGGRLSGLHRCGH